MEQAKLIGPFTPFTPTGSGNNDGAVRDGEGWLIADCGGNEAHADAIALLLNQASGPRV